jgi:alpha-D-xyloside xylohydrolase
MINARKIVRPWWLLLIFVAGLALLPAHAASRQNSEPLVQSAVSSDDALLIHLSNGVLRLKPCSETVIRVSYAPGQTIPDLSNPVIADSACKTVPFQTQETATSIDLLTNRLKVSVNRFSGAVHFNDIRDRLLLSEADWPSPRAMAPITQDAATIYRASVWFALTPEERFYGLGQHQNGILNQRNLELELSQDNTNISIPFFMSSKGYGVLWNNASVTQWNNRFQPVLAIESSQAQAVDYFFIDGPEFDSIIEAYRQLTGAAPLFPLSAYGYWQSKLAYRSQSEIEEVAAKYRDLHIPIDNIVLDAGWETALGSRVFNPSFPDPNAMVQTLHDENVHLMVSVWPLFETGSQTFEAMLKDGSFLPQMNDPGAAYYPGSRLYDALNPAARKIYWSQIKSALFDRGVDSFWMDSTEPADFFAEERGPALAGITTASGDGSRFANLYPFMTTKAIYDGQRGVTDRKRVFILTRSAFLGMQRNAAAAWSGDIATNFETLKRQIPAGLNYSMSGLPYWTTDIGGFLGGDTSDPAYQELFVRWFQYGAFCPIFRAHGTRTNNQNELWSYGARAQSILKLYDRLHYRLIPYIYTLAAKTTFEGYTPMRALAFDFRSDPKSLDINDEFMYGPSLLVAPVTEAKAIDRWIYLPEGADWYDFWTGRKLTGGKNVRRRTPLSIMPLYVRSGTILPLGPEEEYTTQHPDAPIELRIYAGADANFKLYEDDGETYDYEKGNFSWIPVSWDNKTRTVTFGVREGEFAGALSERIFHVVLVGAGRGIGERAGVGRTVRYDGSQQKLRLPIARAAKANAIQR